MEFADIFESLSISFAAAYFADSAAFRFFAASLFDGLRRRASEYSETGLSIILERSSHCETAFPIDAEASSAAFEEDSQADIACFNFS